MIRYPVYKNCPVCGGIGSTIIIRYPEHPYDSTSGNYPQYSTCENCNGTGKIETDQFIEVWETITISYDYNYET